MDDSAARAHGVERGRTLAVPDQIRVAFILEDRDAVVLQQPQQLAPALFSHDRGGRILHGRDRVDVLGADAAALEVRERRRQRIHAHAARVQRNADGVDAEARQARERAAIARLLDDDGVAAREQNAVDEIERLQRAGRDQDLVGVAGDAGMPLELGGQELAQRTIAERTALETVGRQGRSLARQHRGDGGDQPVDRNLLRVVVTADEVVFRKARPLGCRRRQSASQQGREVERPGGHGYCLLAACSDARESGCLDRDARLNEREGPEMGRTSAPNPKFAHIVRQEDCELRVQRGTRIIELLVSLDSEVRIRVCRNTLRTSESGH